MEQPEDLKVRTKKFALRVINLVRSLPNNMVSYEIGKQLLRSGTSVASNTRAAYRGRSKKEFIAKLGIVVEECDESLFWMELLIESHIIDGSKIDSLMKEADELTAIFVSISKKNKYKL
jgi:four helix bundle protein